MPNGTNVTELAATFAGTGVNVKVGANVQTSGQTVNDFTNSVTYTVTVADNSTVAYTITVGFSAIQNGWRTKTIA
jgi:hypothetical protein